MKINSITYTTNIPQNTSRKNTPPPQREKLALPSAENIRAYHSVSFSGLKRSHPYDNNQFFDTCFYRDIETLKAATDFIKEEFPNGTDILDIACSNGEETISLETMLNDLTDKKYKIHAFDTNNTPLELANQRIYSVYTNGHEDFLLNNKSDEYKNELKNRFMNIMEETDAPDFEINDSGYFEAKQLKDKDFRFKFFKLKDEFKDIININKGDINDLPDLLPNKKTGAIFFRNAMYFPTQNYVFKHLSEYEMPSENINRRKIINNIVDKVYDKLLPGGFFILGNNEKDHHFLADSYTHPDDKFYWEYTNQEICLTSPLKEALLKGGRFKPIFKSDCDSAMGLREVITVWQKVK